MAKVFIEESTLVGISDSIRAKTGSTGLIKPGDWAAELDNIKSSGKYLWSKKGMADTYTTTNNNDGNWSKVLVTPNETIPSVEIEVCPLTNPPVYNADKGVWEMNDSHILTLVNTDNNTPYTILGNLFYSGFFLRFTAEPNIWYRVGSIQAGTMNTSGTCTKSMYYGSYYTAAEGDILCYAVSDDSSAYPDGAWLDGYYYEVVGGLIEFTIAGTHYYADEGMNWGDWIKSDFNTAGYTNATISGIASPSGTIQSIDDVIIDGLAYVWD